MKKKIIKWKVAAVLAAALVALTGCGAGKSTDAVAEYDSSAYSGSDDFYGQKSVVHTEDDVSQNETDSVETNRKLIKTVNMTVETEEYDDLVNLLKQKIQSLGGYTQYFSTKGTGSDRYGSMTIRIPRKNLDAFLETVEGASNITYREENVEDVTLDYVDVESRKKVLEKERERLVELLGQAESLDDMLTIESRLTDVQAELESKESQLRTYDNQIDYSTIYLDIEEVVRYTPQEQEGTWERISTGFIENLYLVGTGVRDFFIAVIIHIPNIIVFLVVVGILTLIVRAIIKAEQKNNIKKQEKIKNQQMARMQKAAQVQQPGQPVQNVVNNKAPDSNDKNLPQQ